MPNANVPEWLDYFVEAALPREGLTGWVPGRSFAASSLVRVPRFPESIEDGTDREIELDLVRNGLRSAQLAVASTDPIIGLRAEISEFTGPDGATIDSDTVEIRFVDYVSVERSYSESQGVNEIARITDGDSISGCGNPDLIADPLLKRDTISVPAYRAQPIWFSFHTPRDVSPGVYHGTITLVTDDHDPITYDTTLTIADVVAPNPRDGSFHLDVWFHPDAVAAEHGAERWSEDHWSLLEVYLNELASVGQRVIAAPIIHQPWQANWLHGSQRPQTATGYESLIDWHYDEELHFDYGRFDRFVDTALACGVGPYISVYSMLTFNDPQRISYYDAEGTFTVDRTEAGSERWREAWTAFLSDFSVHLETNGWLDQTYLGFDERPPEQMEAAIDLVEDVAPEFANRIQVAGSIDVEPYADDLSVLHRHLPLDTDVIAERRAAGKTTTFYVCVSPPHPNTFTVSPLVESRLLPWIAAAENLDGFLRWAYNSWPENPFENPVYKFTQGDEYLIYPGDDNPLSSVRWEQLREGIQEYELVTRLRERNHGAADQALNLATHATPDTRDMNVTDVIRARQLVTDGLISQSE